MRYPECTDDHLCRCPNCSGDAGATAAEWEDLRNMNCNGCGKSRSETYWPIMECSKCKHAYCDECWPDPMGSICPNPHCMSRVRHERALENQRAYLETTWEARPTWRKMWDRLRGYDICAHARNSHIHPNVLGCADPYDFYRR